MSVEPEENKGPVKTPNKGNGSKKKDKKKEKSAKPNGEVKEKKAKKSASTTIFRDGSMVNTLYERLKDGEAMTMAKLFKDLDSGDQNRLLTDLRNGGRKHEEFLIERLEDGKLKMVPYKEPKAKKDKEK